VHALAGAYALDALEDAERDRFERHLTDCRSCTDEVRGFTATATMLGIAAAVEPPPELRPRVLAVVAALGVAQAGNAEIAAVLAARDAQTTSAATSAGGTATVIASLAEGKVVFTSYGLRALSPSEVYELWFIGTGGARPAALLPSATPVLVAGLAAGDAIGVTVEPAGGSAAPTTTPIVVMAVAA
jgi:anti-sigma-K factor RskA